MTVQFYKNIEHHQEALIESAHPVERVSLGLVGGRDLPVVAVQRDPLRRLLRAACRPDSQSVEWIYCLPMNPDRAVLVLALEFEPYFLGSEWMRFDLTDDKQWEWLHLVAVTGEMGVVLESKGTPGPGPSSSPLFVTEANPEGLREVLAIHSMAATRLEERRGR